MIQYVIETADDRVHPVVHLYNGHGDEVRERAEALSIVVMIDDRAVAFEVLPGMVHPIQ